MAKKRIKAVTITGIWSKLVRELDDYTCQVCHKSFRHDPGFLDASHHIPRAHGATKWELDNGSSKCRKCHGEMDRQPLEHIEWIKNRLGEERYEALRMKGTQPMKMTDKDRRELAASLRKQLKEAQERNRDLHSRKLARGKVAELQL